MNSYQTKNEHMGFLMPLIACSMLIFLAFLLTTQPVLADNTAATTAMTDIIGIVIKIASIVCFVLGAIYLINGIIKYAAAHADENGAAEKKAANTLAAAIILIAVGGVILTLEPELTSMISSVM